MGLSKYLSVSELTSLKVCISIVHIIEKFQKTEFDKYATRNSVFSITSIYFTMDQNCHNSC